MARPSQVGKCLVCGRKFADYGDFHIYLTKDNEALWANSKRIEGKIMCQSCHADNDRSIEELLGE